MSPRKQPAKRGGVSDAAVSVLRRCQSGEQLNGTRRFPFAYTFAFGNADYADAGSRVSKAIVASLVEAGYLTASQPNPMADVIHYNVTDSGRVFAKHGQPPADDSQIDWTAA